jgi:hypothetical protein
VGEGDTKVKRTNLEIEKARPQGRAFFVCRRWHCACEFWQPITLTMSEIV